MSEANSSPSKEVTIREIAANGFTFRCREAGPRNGELVVLLHGFPETSHMWVKLMPVLAEAGFRVLAPDQRGYSPGARPEGKQHYRYADTSSDVFALADALGSTRFHLVGHDWGAGAGWAAVCSQPQKVASWTALSVPHVKAFGTAIREDADQKNRSQYVNLFVTEGIAEDTLLANDAAVLKGIWSESDEDERAEYISILTQREALTGGLNWYRGSDGISPAGEGITFGDVSVPTLMIWGNKDNAIGRKSNDDALQYMKGPYRWVELDAGHWLIQEKFAEVSAEILAHLRAHPMRPA